MLALSLVAAHAQCKLTVSTRKFEGADRTVVTMENERILVEVVPELEGRISRYVDKSKPACAFEWLDDCPYHYGGRWEGKPFEYQVDARGPDRAAVTVKGGGKIAVALLHDLLGVDIANPIDLAVERTMSIDANSTRLRMDVKITNTGDGVAPTFRYMVHAVFGQVPPMKEGRAFWFLPTSAGNEFFDSARGMREMGESGGAGGAPVDHPFSRFTPGRKADKPRYEAGGWGALLTSAGPTYIYYDPKQFDFMQYWHGGDSEWHFTFEPHSKPVDLKPGESVSCAFTLAYDSKDVPFDTPTLVYERPTVPEIVMPGGTLQVKARATTVQGRPEAAKVGFEVKDPKGQVILSKEVAGEVQPFAFTELAAEVKLPEDAALGFYTWRMATFADAASANRADGKELAAGRFEVATAQEVARRQMERATADLRAQIDTLKKDLAAKDNEFRRLTELWRDGADLALGWEDPAVWPASAPPGASVSVVRGAVPVAGLWKAKEPPRIKALAPARFAGAAPANTAAPWPADPEKLLAALGADRACVRDVAPDAGGKGLVALLVDPAKRRTEVVRLGEAGVVRRFGRFADKPGEKDDTLGAGARAVAVDEEGNIWVATNAWGQTSVFRRGADGAPFEESVVGEKGAVKRFAPDGKLLGCLSLLEAPTDLALALADGAPIVLAPYRSVSEYHGAQVREGVILARVADGQRIGELKVPAGSVAVDDAGRVWAADVAGHVTCHDLRGRKLLDAAGSPPPAVPDARLPASSPLPVVLRAAGKGSLCALFTLGRKLVTLDPTGAPRGEGQAVPAAAGALWRLAITPDGPSALGDKGLWHP